MGEICSNVEVISAANDDDTIQQLVKLPTQAEKWGGWDICEYHKNEHSLFCVLAWHVTVAATYASFENMVKADTMREAEWSALDIFFHGEFEIQFFALPPKKQ